MVDTHHIRKSLDKKLIAKMAMNAKTSGVSMNTAFQVSRLVGVSKMAFQVVAK